MLRPFGHQAAIDAATRSASTTDLKQRNGGWRAAPVVTSRKLSATSRAELGAARKKSCQAAGDGPL